MNKLLISGKPELKNFYYKGSRVLGSSELLKLFEVEIDGRLWYKIVAIGPTLQKYYRKLGVPTNIDHIDSYEEALSIYEILLKGSYPSGLVSKLEKGTLVGFTPNVYLDESIRTLGKVQPPFKELPWLSGQGGVMSINPTRIKAFALSNNIPESVAFTKTIKHEFKHMDDLIRGVDIEDPGFEVGATKIGWESVLEEDVPIKFNLILNSLAAHKSIGFFNAWDKANEWEGEWNNKYPGLVIKD